MNHQEIVENILKELQKQTKSSSFREKYFGGSHHFTRKREFPLHEVIAFLIQRSGNGLDIKLDEWFSTWKPEKEKVISRQSVSKTRQLLPEKIFRDFLKLSSRMFMEKCEKLNSWYGYQLYAIDGTDLQIPTTKENLKMFGSVKSPYGTQTAGASGSALFDITNDIILDAVICPYKTNERKMAIELLDSVMTSARKKSSIVIMDRGYPGYDFLGYLYDHDINFVIRVKEQMTRLRNMKRKDGEVYRKCGGKCRTIRTIEIDLKTGSKEYLITNMSGEEMAYGKFEELYFRRWGIEGKYKELKSRLELENFSGKKAVCIKQDYFINLFLSNICSLMKQEVDKKIYYKEKEDKEYQTRRSYLIYQMNQKISGLILGLVNVEECLTKIVEMSKKKRSQIRRNRTCERNLNLNRRKYCMNYKSCI